jgi:small conductance mechanosensitive channel
MKLEVEYEKAIHWLIVHGSELLISFIILLVGLKLIKLLGGRLRNRMSKRKVHSSLQPFVLSLSITALYILLIIVVFNINGYDITVFSTILGGLTVAVGLALSGTFQNFAGGVLILLLKPFLLDDNIIAQGQDGTVMSIQIFYTVLRTPDNKTIIIPNGKLFNEVIVNVTREGKRRLDFEVKLGYAADINKAKQIMLDAIKSTKSILEDQPVRVGVVGLEIDSIRFTVNVWVLPADFLNVKIDLMEKMLIDLAAAGIPFPKAG